MMRRNSRCSFFSGMISGMVLSGALVIGLQFAKEFTEKVKKRQQVKTLLPIHPVHEGHGYDSSPNEYPITFTKVQSAVEAAPSPVMVGKQGEAPTSASGKTVYWTEYGKTYHIDPKCTSISRSKDVHSGSISEATAHVARTPCHYCSQG